MSDDNATQVVNTETQIFLIDSKGVSTKVIGEMIVGRSDQCDLVVDDPKASRKHAKIWQDGDVLVVEDLGSTNGTHHQGKRKAQFRSVTGETISFPNIAYQVKIEQAFAAKDFDPDKTMPIDLSKIASTETPAVEESSQIPVKETSAAEPEALPEAKRNVTSNLDKNPPAAEKPKQEEKSSAWWESDEIKSDGTSIFKIDGLADEDADLGLAKLGPAVEPRLVIKSGPGAGTEFKLGMGSLVIGKDSSCDIQLKESTVSDQHAKLIHDGHTWQLVNLLALNHSLVNNVKVQSVFLNSGDQIRLGGALLVFQLPSSSLKETSSKSKKKLILASLVSAVAAGLIFVFLKGFI